MNEVKVWMRGFTSFAFGHSKCNCKDLEIKATPIPKRKREGLYFLECIYCKEIMCADRKGKYLIIVNLWDDTARGKTGNVLYDSKIAGYNDDNKFPVEIATATGKPTKGSRGKTKTEVL